MPRTTAVKAARPPAAKKAAPAKRAAASKKAAQAQRAEDIAAHPPQDGVDLSITPHPTLQGVWLNSRGQAVDSRGVALSYLKLREAVKKDEELVLGHEVETPAQFLKAVALDARLPVYTRLEAAKAAAPYTDRKMPVSVEGTDGPPIQVATMFAPEALRSKLTREERAVLQRILVKLGAGAAE